MANQIVYPYGTNGELPSSIGVINDLVTGGANKALAAEQGHEVIERTAFSNILDLGNIQVNIGAILVDGTVETNNLFSYTDPVYFDKDCILKVMYWGRLFAPVSETDENASYYSPLYIDNRPAWDGTSIYVSVSAGTYLAFCYGNTKDHYVASMNGIKDSFFSKYEFNIAKTGQYIDRYLSLKNVNNYIISSPIKLKKGETINVHTRGGLNTVIASSDNSGNLLEALVFNDNFTGDDIREFFYTANSDMYVVVSGYNAYNDFATYIFTEESGFLRRFELLEEKTKDVYHNGIYLYPFRAIVGKRVVLYKDSIVCGLKPSCNYQVGCIKGDNTQNYTRETLSYLPTNAGTEQINVYVRDVMAGKLVKIVSVTSSIMPSVKLSNSEPIDVLWMGDSLIAFNGNLIGAEWIRMLTTNDQEVHVDSTTKAKQIPTYNVCPGKLTNVGEQSWESRYMYAYTVEVLMTGKRTAQYNPNRGRSTSATENPWYNPNSTKPDEVGADGFNKRVDLKWYFDNACGVGKYPKLFYISIGVNDVAESGWSFDSIPGITEKFVLLCKKIKSECDIIAGGNSGIKIKILNHQTYPLYNMYNYELDQFQQRLCYKLLYDSYYNAINDPENGISGYVELIDCASRFDWRVSYTHEEFASNPRYDGNQDIFIAECCHMNKVGAYNYADALIDDFLADSGYN